MRDVTCQSLFLYAIQGRQNTSSRSSKSQHAKKSDDFCFVACDHGWRIVETRGGAFPLVAVQFKAKWWIIAVLHRYKPNMNVKTTITLMDICLKRCFIKFSFILRGCFWQWEGALPSSGGARAPSKPLILRPCLWQHYSKWKPSVNTFIRKEIVRSFECRILQSRTTHQSWVIPRPTGGGGYFEPPSRFLAISSKPLQVSPPNLQYTLSQHFYTLC